MSDAFNLHGGQILEHQQRLGYVTGASGVAFAINDRVVSFDLFDKTETCRSVWGRLLSGVVFDALAAGKADRIVSAADVERQMAGSRNLAWEQSEAVGEGVEYRAESTRGDHASALAFRGTLVHGSLMTAV